MEMAFHLEWEVGIVLVEGSFHHLIHQWEWEITHVNLEWLVPVQEGLEICVAEMDQVWTRHKCQIQVTSRVTLIVQEVEQEDKETIQCLAEDSTMSLVFMGR